MSNSTKIELTTVHCVSTSEFGHDEVYIKYSVDNGRNKRFPSSNYHSMAAGDDWHPDLIISFKNSLTISLYDNDLGHDEFLGSYTYSPDDPQPETVTASNTNGAEYKLSTVAVD